jgi:hypothetical protein
MRPWLHIDKGTWTGIMRTEQKGGDKGRREVKDEFTANLGVKKGGLGNEKEDSDWDLHGRFSGHLFHEFSCGEASQSKVF